MNFIALQGLHAANSEQVTSLLAWPQQQNKATVGIAGVVRHPHTTQPNSCPQHCALPLFNKSVYCERTYDLQHGFARLACRNQRAGRPEKDSPAALNAA